jgi:hypothetical protein
MAGRDAEVRKVAAELDTVLAGLEEAVTALRGILTKDAEPADGGEEVTAQ